MRKQGLAGFIPKPAPFWALALGLQVALASFASPAFAGDDPPSSPKKEEKKSKKKKNRLPSKPEDAYGIGLQAFEDGDLPFAIEALKFHLTAAKPIANAWFILGRALGKQSKYKEAREALNQYLTLEPKSAQADTAAKLLKDFDVLEATRFAVTSEPRGANFALDAVDGPAVDAPGDLYAEPGPHKLFVTLAGYEVQIVDATAKAGEAVPVSVKLQFIGCDLRADVLVPATSATMKVDDGTPESTPGPIRITPGKHTVEIAAVGGEGTSKQVTCNQDEPLTVSMTVPTSMQGRLSIQIPPGAKLQIDGKDQEAKDGGRALIDLQPGEHLVDVEAEGKVPWHAATAIHAGETTDLVPSLEAGGGATGLEVIAHPGDARISVDGKPVASGQMNRTGPGKHTVEVRAPGYFATSRNIEIISGERSHVEIRLEQRGRFLLYRCYWDQNSMRFTVVDRERREPVAAPRSPAADPGAVRILLVEDDADNREAMATLLGLGGHHVTAAPSGHDGLRQFQPDSFDVVLTDLGLPDMTGWEVARHVKELSSKTPVALITGWGLNLAQEEIERRGVDLLIKKPIEPRTFLSRLAALGLRPLAALGLK